jgi:cyclase
MLKPRLIGLVLVRYGIAVQSLQFRRYLPLGRPEIAVEYLDRWGVDEIMLLDIQATNEKRTIDPTLVESCAACCRTPLTVGGGISAIAPASTLLSAGADKICLNSAANGNPELVEQLASRFGSQCIVVSIDVEQTKSSWQALTSGGTKSLNRGLEATLAQAQDSGAGEILINSIDRDGSRRGFDLDLIRHCSTIARVPLIAAGGAGHPSHLAVALDAGASAVAVGNMLHFTEHSVIVAKRYMQYSGKPVRLDSPASYSQTGFLDSGRLAMAEEARLDAERFNRLPPDPV